MAPAQTSSAHFGNDLLPYLVNMVPLCPRLPGAYMFNLENLVRLHQPVTSPGVTKESVRVEEGILVDDEGFEPSTPALRTRCSPN